MMRQLQRRRRTASVFGLCAAIGGLVVGGSLLSRRSVAQDSSPPDGPVKEVDKLMGLIGGNQIDDALSAMDGVKDNPDQKNAVRSALLAVRDHQVGNYHGYDTAATVRFSSRLQALDVLGYYDQQPVLYRFEYYQPAGNQPWQVLDLKIDGDLSTMTETLRDDASGVALGRGGRLAR